MYNISYCLREGLDELATQCPKKITYSFYQLGGPIKTGNCYYTIDSLWAKSAIVLL